MANLRKKNEFQFCIKNFNFVLNLRLNVHLISHSHDDTGWLKTVDQVILIFQSNLLQNSFIAVYFELRVNKGLKLEALERF